MIVAAVIVGRRLNWQRNSWFSWAHSCIRHWFLVLHIFLLSQIGCYCREIYFKGVAINFLWFFRIVLIYILFFFLGKFLIWSKRFFFDCIGSFSSIQFRRNQIGWINVMRVGSKIFNFFFLIWLRINNFLFGWSIRVIVVESFHSAVSLGLSLIFSFLFVKLEI